MKKKRSKRQERKNQEPKNLLCQKRSSLKDTHTEHSNKKYTKRDGNRDLQESSNDFN
jgi:hypothetical protein